MERQRSAHGLSRRQVGEVAGGALHQAHRLNVLVRLDEQPPFAPAVAEPPVEVARAGLSCCAVIDVAAPAGVRATSPCTVSANNRTVSCGAPWPSTSTDTDVNDEHCESEVRQCTETTYTYERSCAAGMQ